MTYLDDNIRPFPTALERLAVRAKQAMTAYAVGLSHEQKNRTAAIQAAIEYGRALIEGREQYESDQAFAQWVKAEGLDAGKPWDSRPERTKAMQMARIVGGGSAAPTDFEGCPNSRPSHIMKWYRKLHGPPPVTRRRGGEQEAKALAAIQQLEASGEPVTETAVAKAAHVSQSTAHKTLAIYLSVQEARAKAIDETTIEVTEDQALAAFDLKPKDKIKLTDAIRIHKNRLEKNFNQLVDQEVRRRIAEADDHTRQSLVKERKKNQGLERILHGRGVFTAMEYKQLLMVCHPDNSASPAMRARILDIVVKHEDMLIKR